MKSTVRTAVAGPRLEVERGDGIQVLADRPAEQREVAGQVAGLREEFSPLLHLQLVVLAASDAGRGAAFPFARVDGVSDSILAVLHF